MNTITSATDSLESALTESKSAPLAERVETYNRIVRLASAHLNLPHPATCPQLVPVESVEGNDYNPNKVAPPEMRLLSLSIAKDGLTMPVVVASNGKGNSVVVDGFHRTTVVRHTAAIRESLGGYLPVVKLDKPLEERVAATVRHNMARGTHQVELSAKLVLLLKKHNWSNTRIGKELGMDADEVLRLKQITGLAEAFADKAFSKAWE